MDSRKVIIGFTFAAMVSLTLALFSSKSIALIAFPMVGFFASVMWSIIISLALNSVSKHHGSFSGILVTGIAGRCGHTTYSRLVGRSLWLTNGHVISLSDLWIYFKHWVLVEAAYQQ